MTNPKIYWRKIKIKKEHSCPNVSLFRFISDLKFNYKNKKILELGFGHGADIYQFKKRGSDVYGIDINKSAVQTLKEKYRIKNSKCMDVVKQTEFFNKVKFNLIYHRDLIYYLSDIEIKKLQNNVYQNLKKNGLYLFQFIENDMKIKKNETRFRKINKNYLSNFYNKKFAEKNNPLRFLNVSEIFKITKKAGFILIGKKVLIESYGQNESKLRVNRYLMFKKNENIN